MAKNQEQPNKDKRKADKNLTPADEGRQEAVKRQKTIDNCFKETKAISIENEEKGVDGDGRKDESEKPINKGDEHGKKGERGKRKGSKGGKGGGTVEKEGEETWKGPVENLTVLLELLQKRRTVDWSYPSRSLN